MKKFDVDVIIDDKYTEPKITIYAKTKSKEVEEILEAINKVGEDELQYVSAYLDGKLELIDYDDVVRIVRVDRQVVLETEKTSYILKKPLAQLDEELDNKKFLRISQSEIINVYKVQNLDFSISGTIVIEFSNGKQSYVSRRFVKSVKKFFED